MSYATYLILFKDLEEDSQSHVITHIIILWYQIQLKRVR